MSTLIHRASKIVTITPVITAQAYTSGKQVGGLNLIAEAALQDGGLVLLQSLSVIDKAKQKSALSLFLFDDVPTLISSDTGTFDLTDAQAALNLLAVVPIPAANYVDSNSNSIATVAGVGVLLRSNAGNNGVGLPAGATKRSLWAVLVSAGTPTYASTSDLVLKLALEQH